MDLNSGPQQKNHQIMMIKKIQKAFTKHIKRCSSFSYQERLSNLKIYSLQHRRERYIIIYVWKILEHIGGEKFGTWHSNILKT